MVLVLGIAGLIWFGGQIFGLARAVRIVLLLILYVAILGLHLTMPEGNALRQATGGTAMVWLILGFCALAVAGYARILAILKTRAHSENPAPVNASMPLFSETELNRYARHIVLREIGGPGQKKLKNARVLVIGAGGLGAPALQYLAAAGVGTIGVIDDDVVENANLQRQVIHRDDDIGKPKVFSAQSAMLSQNPAISVLPFHRRLTEEIAGDLFEDFDLILDGTDNFESRYLANRVAAAQSKPLISGALAQWEGQISVFDPGRGGPCYQCVFPTAPAPGLAPSCAEAGVVGPLPGVIGSMMALEAIKIITGAGDPLRGEMLIYDALYSETRKFRLSQRDDCPVCGNNPM